MATIKGTLICEGIEHGWTESYFWQGSSGNLTAATAILNNIAQKRAPLLGGDDFIKARRVSVELDDLGLPVRGDAQLRKTPRYNGSLAQPAAMPGVALQLRFENSAGTNHRNTYLRGVWDIIETADGEYRPNDGPGWGGYMGAYLASLLGASGAVCGWIARGNVAPAEAQVLGYSTEETGQITFQTSAAVFNPLSIGKRVHIRVSGLNAPEKSVLNREWVVTVNSSSTATTIIPVAAFPFTTPGKIRVFSYVFVPAATVIEEGMVFRAPGRPLLVRRGRGPRRVMG